MSTSKYALRDTRTMLRRNLKRILRYPSMTLIVVAIPVVFLLLFVYVFGGTVGDGIGGVGGRAEYVNYVTPGILLFGVVGAATSTAVTVAMDMTEGIVARFRTMSIFRPAILTSHVVASVVQQVVSSALVLGVALLIGFDPNANFGQWMGAIGVFLLFVLAVTWFGVGIGLASKSVESASNAPMPLMLLPFLGSGFVPTDKMPAWLGWFADNQPFTPVIETMRGLLMGTHVGGDAIAAIAWCVGISVACFVWARRRINREPGH
ncbi:MAG TPA: ABC transporter permease [Stackebrandtia sp.]|jgi:ABC-2 type transport system permease protein|uniref:ABC transporter permease n=1 Tax=Stackebrandtia sp. TaxID=2023065 RepID=UPI002D4B90B2|nr:ABC transporter permease [Stackebrandtia sp.]HZE40041.1 ABC transporter permease [Stackebrandtia sp.]